MPFSSAEIAASVGAFQGQSMNNMAYSQMIGMGSYANGGMADRMAGGMMSRVGGMAGPLAAGALGLAGLDPMSLGLKAGMGAFGHGAGILGAGAIGLGTMAGVGAVGAGIGYAGNQIMTGAQQQSALNGALRSNFNFVNGQGGQGFSRGDMSQIGGMMRAMTHQFGPEGQITGMGELTNLAANMGKMGMATGVKDAQEFSKRFREMITTLKSVAKELGSSLEEAQQFMSAQRGSGIFKAGDQARFASMARGTSVAGGVALSEVTGMASIGSQIARSVGGLGRQGAFGGMRAIGQVGMAVQTGALSEEDIYNSTGLTGAEGRQAMASNMMAGGASFLKSGRGRYFLASMAGKNGSLDEESVQNWMNGTMDVGSTKSQANSNLAKVGRANFIRNEGRLRGSVLERFGALAPTMAYQQWLSSRGYDPNHMDDKSMLAFQRFSGMGRDEADNAISMVQKLPEMLAHQRQSANDDKYAQEMGAYRKTHGIEGIKNKIEQMREGINGKLQKVGQDLFTSTSDMVERFFNRAMGITEQRTTENIDQLWRAAKMGGAGGSEIMSMISAKGLGGLHGPGGGGMGGQDLQGYQRSERMRTAATLGGAGGRTAAVGGFADGARGWLRDAYTAQGGLGSQSGEARMKSFGAMLEGRAKGGDANAKAMLERWSSSSTTDSQRAAMLAETESRIGIADSIRLGKSWEESKTGLAKGLFATEREGDIASGRSLLGRGESTLSKALGLAGEMAAANPLTGIANIIGKATGKFDLGGMLGETFKNIGGTLSGESGLEAGAGKYLRSAEGKSLIYKGLTGGAKGREGLQDKIQDLAGKKDLSDEEKGQLTLMRQSLVASQFRELQEGKGGPEAQKAFLEKAKGIMGRDVSMEEAGQMMQNIGSEMGKIQRADYAKIAGREVKENIEKEKAYGRLGVAVLDKNNQINLTGAVSDRLRKEVGEKGSQAAKLAMETMNTTGRLTGDPEKDGDILKEIQAKSGKLYDSISEMSIPEKTKFAKIMAGTEVGSMAGESLMRERRLKSMMGHGRGVVGGIGGLLGVDMTKEEMAGLKGKDASEMAAFFASKKGIKDETFEKSLTESIKAAQSGKIGSAADILNRGIAQSKEAQEKLAGKKDSAEEMVEVAKQSSKYLEALVKSNDAAKAILSDINAKTEKGNAEGEGGKK